MVGSLGYTLEDAGEQGWGNREDDEKFNDIVNSYSLQARFHKSSIYADYEENMENLAKIDALIKYTKTHTVSLSRDEVAMKDIQQYFSIFIEKCLIIIII